MKIIVTLLICCLFVSSAFSQEYKQGGKVEIKWNNTWYKGAVVEVKDSKYKVHYDGWTSSRDEWVDKDRLRILGNSAAGNGSNSSTKETTQTAVITGANPMAGKWEATISNGYKGDKLVFTISADGKQVENVTFTGYWQNRDRTIEVLKNLDPPNPFLINKGAFSAVQQVSKSRIWWEFTGRFLTYSTAEGTYRVAYAGVENDTYKLKWTAKRIGK
jgi:hypothetical protein